MTNQEIFDKVKKHLLTQNAKAQNVTESGVKVCKYRADDGKMCAAGCLIVNYDPKIEGFAFNSLYQEEQDRVLGFHVTQENKRLISYLQNLHDTVDPIMWPERLEHIRQDFKLV